MTRGDVPGDRRASLASLTDAGRQRLQQAWPAHLAGVRAIALDHVDAADLGTLERLVGQLLSGVEAASDSRDRAPPALPTQPTAAEAPREQEHVHMNVTAWILSALLADPKMAWAEDFTDAQVRGIGAVEVLGAIGLVLPWLLDIARILTPLAALGLAITMALALLVHARRGEVKQALPVNTVLFVVAVVVAVIRFSQP